MQVSSQGVRNPEKLYGYALTSRMPRSATACFVFPFFLPFLSLLAFSDETAALQGGGPVTAALSRAVVL